MSEFKESQKMKVVKINEWTPKQFLNLTLNQKNSPIRPQKVKTTPKLSRNQTSKLKETKKMKIAALYEQTTKLFEPDPNPKNSPFETPKVKSDPKIK